MVFKDRFEDRINVRYKAYRTNPTFDLIETGQIPVGDVLNDLVIIDRSTTPTSYLPYRYESTSRDFRDFMATQRHEFLFVKHRHDLPTVEIDLFAEKIPADMMSKGVGEKVEQLGRVTRWAMGPSTFLEFWEHSGRPVLLEYELLNFLVSRQDVEVYVNGVKRDGFTLAKEGPTPAAKANSLVFDPVQGMNVLEFRFSDWNGKTNTFIPTDLRPFASVFLQLRLETAGAGQTR